MNFCEMNFRKIGKLIKPFGIKGEMKTVFYVDENRDLEVFSAFYVKDKLSATGYKIIVFELMWENNGKIIVNIEGCNDRNTADTFRELEVFVDEAEFPELEQGDYYIKDLLGLDVVQNGEKLGEIDNFIDVANSSFAIVRLTNGKEFAMPFNDEYLVGVDIDDKKISVRNTEELI